MTSLNTCLRSKPQAQAGGANGAVTLQLSSGRAAPLLINLNHLPGTKTKMIEQLYR